MSLTAALMQRYASCSESLRNSIIRTCREFVENGFGDNDAQQKLCSANDAYYWQQLSEVLLADQLSRNQIDLTHPRIGPDFLIEHEGQRIWIEVITPGPNGLPDEWLNYVEGTAISYPHEAMLLRWTSAIKQKAEVLLGNAERGVAGYIAKGIVSIEDVYVIAINGRLLRGYGSAFPQLLGISQFPFAVEATFCVGPRRILIDRQTLKTVGTDYQNRPVIPKPSGSAVPADTFMDPQYALISAIWAVDIDEGSLSKRVGPMAVVHNPQSINPLPSSFLPAQEEFKAIDRGDYYQLDRLAGSLSAN